MGAMLGVALGCFGVHAGVDAALAQVPLVAVVTAGKLDAAAYTTAVHRIENGPPDPWSRRH